MLLRLTVLCHPCMFYEHPFAILILILALLSDDLGTLCGLGVLTTVADHLLNRPTLRMRCCYNFTVSLYIFSILRELS